MENIGWNQRDYREDKDRKKNVSVAEAQSMSFHPSREREPREENCPLIDTTSSQLTNQVCS